MEAPEIADPDLSVTVPKKLPVAWPYVGCPQQHNTAKQTTTANTNLLLIPLTPLGDPQLTNFQNSKPGKRVKRPLVSSGNIGLPKIKKKHVNSEFLGSPF